MGQPPNPIPAVPITAGTVRLHIQDIFKQKLSFLHEALGDDARFLDGTTGGFYGCTGELSLGRIEKLVDTSIKLGIPMTEWGGEQCAVIYLLSVSGAIRLDPERYFNFFSDQLHKVADARLIHFIGTERFYKNIYANCASSVAATLCREPRTTVAV
jgi:hypothetical protein